MRDLGSNKCLMKTWRHRVYFFNHQAYFKTSVFAEAIKKQIRQPALILQKFHERYQNNTAGVLGTGEG